MPVFVLCHAHRPDECGAAFAAWRGFDSPLRGRAALATCRAGGHRVWWTVEAPSTGEALGHLPPFVAERTSAERAWEIPIP